jgi:RNA polymerase sigma-70 factor (ECF subfamily)
MRPDELTDMGGMQRRFLTTHWSLIQTMGQDEDKDKDHALIDLLIKRYWKPVYCYLRRRGYGNEQAKDLTQGFFHDVVLGRHLIQKADPAKGRFRSFLLMALKRYLLTVCDKETAQKRIPQSKLTSLEIIEEDELLQVCTQLTSEDAFNYWWISALLERVLAQVRAECYQDGKTAQWHVFQARILDPIMDRTPPLSLHDICHKYGIKDSAKASNMIVTVKRRFSTALRKHLRDSVTSDEEVADELQEMMRFLPNIAQDRI